MRNANDRDGPLHPYIPHFDFNTTLLKQRNNASTATLLDVLAECCLHEARHQSVSISATITQSDLTLYVSQIGGSLDGVVEHLHNVVGVLRRIKESTPSTSENRGSLGVNLRLERDLEIFITKLSYEKLRRRILMHVDTFIDEYVPLILQLPPDHRWETFLSTSYVSSRYFDVPFVLLQALADEFRAVKNKLSIEGTLLSGADLAWLLDRIGGWHKEWVADPAFKYHLWMVNEIGMFFKSTSLMFY